MGNCIKKAMRSIYPQPKFVNNYNTDSDTYSDTDSDTDSDMVYDETIPIKPSEIMDRESKKKVI